MRINCKTYCYCNSHNANCKHDKNKYSALSCAKFKLNEAIGIDKTKAKVVTKLIELVLNFVRSKLNQAIGNAKEKLDTKLKLLVPNFTKTKLNQAIIRLNSKAGNLELKIDVQDAYQAKIGKVTRKLPKLETKWVFLI